MLYGVNASGVEISYVRVAIADTVEPVSSPTLSVVVPMGSDVQGNSAAASFLKAVREHRVAQLARLPLRPQARRL